jgi:hypothetical protein
MYCLDALTGFVLRGVKGAEDLPSFANLLSFHPTLSREVTPKWEILAFISGIITNEYCDSFS